MRIIYRAENIIDAHLVRHVLEAAGIHAHVAGEYLTGAMGDLPALGLVNVMVAAHDMEQAAPLVAEVDAELAQRRLQADYDLDGMADPA